MPCRRNGDLFDQHGPALGTVLAAGQARNRAGRRDGIIIDRPMSHRWNFHISGIAAASAGVVFVPPDLGAGGGLGRVRNEVMPKRAPLGLRLEDQSAGALQPFGQPVLHASGFYGGKDHGYMHGDRFWNGFYC